MKQLWAIIGVVAFAVGCGEGGSLPDGKNPPGPGNTNTQVTSTDQSLWPLSTGSVWEYRITDEVDGVFEKKVEVVGPQNVPVTNEAAVFVKSIQPHLEERSWQQTSKGIVVRLREEDYVGGNRVRLTTWTPGTVKSIDAPQALNWTHQATVRELIVDGSGGVLEDRDKTFTWVVRAVNETVTVPAGTFTNAIKLERDRPDKTGKLRTYWLVPGVGKVREEGERTEELLRYDVK